MRIPNFFIVGAPRCGTGSMWTYLRSHPDVFMPAEKELYFFDSDLWGRHDWAPTLQEYLNHFSAAMNQSQVGEATPSYLRSQRAPAGIKTVSPKAKIIIMLRNPLEVMQSLHSKALAGPEPLHDFALALQADSERRGPALIGYREFTDYPDQLQKYSHLFGRENVHTIIFDDLKLDSAAVCRGVLCFLGVRADFAAAFPWIHGNTEIRNFRLQTTMVQPPRSLRSLARAFVPQQLRSQIRRALLRSNRVVRPRRPMDPALKRRLQKELGPQVERLSRMLDRDLSAWLTNRAEENGCADSN